MDQVLVRAGQSPSPSTGQPFELSPQDTLRTRFLATPLRKTQSEGVFTRLIRDSACRKQAKQVRPERVPQPRRVSGRRIEDELLRKHEEARQEREALKARWDRVVMREVLPAPHISPYSRALAEQAARYGTHLRCCLHDQLPPADFSFTQPPPFLQASEPTSPPTEEEEKEALPTPTPSEPPALSPIEEEPVEVEEKAVQTLQQRRPRPQVRPVGMEAVSATVSLERAREYRAMVERHMALVREP